MSSTIPLIGICQGRLSEAPDGLLQHFPDDWKSEFDSAQQIGFKYIELLAERQYNSSNPIWSDIGRSQLLDISSLYSQQLYSICYDYIIDHSILEPATQSYLFSFLEICNSLNLEIVVLPLLEQSQLLPQNFDGYLRLLSSLSAFCSHHTYKLCIETLVSASLLREFLSDLSCSNIFLVYDTGNRAPIVNSVADEILLLADYIGHVHIKDKTTDGQNVCLGTGLVDFSSVFSALRKISYKGSFALETTRGIKSPVLTASDHLAFVRQYS